MMKEQNFEAAEAKVRRMREKQMMEDLALRT